MKFSRDKNVVKRGIDRTNNFSIFISTMTKRGTFTNLTYLITRFVMYDFTPFDIGNWKYLKSVEVCESPPFGKLLPFKAVISQHESVIINMQFLIHDCLANLVDRKN